MNDFYKGYFIARPSKGHVMVCDKAPPDSEKHFVELYRTTSVDKAKRWVNAYRAGAVWSVLTKR
jgi:hypothetical protein